MIDIPPHHDGARVKRPLPAFDAVIARLADDTPDSALEPGMVLCVESHTGRLGGHEGVKIEEQVLITATGHEQLSAYPLDARISRRTATVSGGVALAVM